MNNLKQVLLVVVFLGTMASSLSARTWYVKADRTGDVPTIQDAIDASSSSDGDVILVAPGTYRGYKNTNLNVGGWRLEIISEAGPEVTIIDVEGSPSRIGRGFTVGTAASLTLSGFTIKNGYIEGYQHGGGVKIGYATVTIENCVFLDNLVEGCGGGIFANSGGTFPSTVIVRNCRFEGNSALYGGAVESYTRDIYIEDCEFRGNHAEAGGAILLTNDGHVRNCVFDGNSVGDDGAGGAVSVSNVDDELAFESCLFVGNVGGTVFRVPGTHGPLVRVRSCTFYGNEPRLPETLGGGTITVGAGENVADVPIENTIIAFSAAGPAIAYNAVSIPSISCTDIYGNAGGDWVGCITGQEGVNGNFSLNPLFCDVINGDFSLNSNSPCLAGNHPSGAVCGLIGAVNEGCGEVHISLDIKPGSCPNPLNMNPFYNPPKNQKPKKGGVLPVALLGTEEFEVSVIDVSTLRLEGVVPLRHGYEDVSTPAEGGEGCACTTLGPDGYVDLTLKFQKSEIVATLGSVGSGDEVALTLTGKLKEGTPFEATDCVTIVGGHAEPPNCRETNEVVLRGAVPNPFNPVTRISYTLPEEDYVRLSVYDIAGRLIVTLVNDTQNAGEHVVEWNASGSTSGIYFCRLETSSTNKTRKLVHIK